MSEIRYMISETAKQVDVECMFTAEFAIFHHFNTIRIVLFILVRLIVALFAICAS